MEIGIIIGEVPPISSPTSIIGASEAKSAAVFFWTDSRKGRSGVKIPEGEKELNFWDSVYFD